MMVDKTTTQLITNLEIFLMHCVKGKGERTLGGREGESHADMGAKSFPGQQNSRCKFPEQGTGKVCLGRARLPLGWSET